MIDIEYFLMIFCIIFVIGSFYGLSYLVALCGKGDKNYDKLCKYFITSVLFSILIFLVFGYIGFNIDTNNQRYITTYNDSIKNDLKIYKTESEIKTYINKKPNLEFRDVLIAKNNNNEISKISINYKYKDCTGLFYLDYIIYIDYN